MNRPARHLLEFVPPVLEIDGFTSPTAEKLRTLFLSNLQQPTYVNRLSLKGSSSGNRTNLVQDFRITLPVGLVLKGTLNGSLSLYAEELSHCCLGSIVGSTCRTCRGPVGFAPMQGRSVYFSRVFALQHAVTEEEREAIGVSGLAELRDDMGERLGQVPGVDVLSASIITEELLDFFQALAASNRDNGAE